MTPIQTINFATQLFLKHDLDYTVQFSRSRSAYGWCDVNKRIIWLSKYFIEIATIKEIRIVLLHEIAHALVPDEGHGKKWAAKCIELGIEPIVKPNLCELPALYNASCQLCNTKYRRNKKPNNHYCSKCPNQKKLEWY